MVEPAFGLPARWISENQKEKAELIGYTVVEAVAVLTTHLLEVLKANAYRLLGRQEVQNLLENLKRDQPALIEELVPNLLPLGIVEKVLQNLLKEKVSVRNLSTILETMADQALITKESDLLTEYVRQALAETIVQPYLTKAGTIQSLTVDPDVERMLNSAVQELKKAGAPVREGALLPPEMLQKFYSGLAEEVEQVVHKGHQPIIVTSPLQRTIIRRLVEAVFPNLVVLSYAEIPARVQIESIGIVRFNDGS